MKQSSVTSTFLALCSVLLQGSVGYNTEDHSVNIPTYTECGGAIPLIWNDKGASARVSYKNGTRFSPNEFCIWTFFAEDAAGDIKIEFRENIQENLDGIVVYTWEDFNLTRLTTYKIPHGNSELTIDVPHFAVAFSSDYSVESNGFYFDVIAERAGDGDKSPKAYFTGRNTGEFTYPYDIGYDYYDDYERVSVVLHGPDATVNKEYGLRDLDTEANYDFVNVYELRGYADALYSSIGQFCGQQSGAVPNSGIITPWPLLYLFSSDGGKTGEGFTITWKWDSYVGTTPRI